MSIHAELYGTVELAGLEATEYRRRFKTLDDATRAIQSIEGNNLIVDYHLTLSVGDTNILNSNRTITILPWWL